MLQRNKHESNRSSHPTTQLSTPCNHSKEKQLSKAPIGECVAPSLWINTKKQFGNLAETSWFSRVCNTSGKCGSDLTSAISSFPIIGFSCAVWEFQATQDFCSAPTPESPTPESWPKERVLNSYFLGSQIKSPPKIEVSENSANCLSDPGMGTEQTWRPGKPSTRKGRWWVQR